MSDLTILGFSLVLMPAFLLCISWEHKDAIFIKAWFAISLAFWGLISLICTGLSYRLLILYPQMPYVKIILFQADFLEMLTEAAFFGVASLTMLILSIRRIPIGRYKWKQNLSLVYLSLIFILFILIPDLFPYRPVGTVSGILDDSFSETSNVMAVLLENFFDPVKNPMVYMTITLMVIGSLAKTISTNKHAKTIGNLFIIWLPSFTFILVILQIIEVPANVVALFGGNKFFGWLMYVMITMTFMVVLSSTQQIFQGLRQKESE